LSLLLLAVLSLTASHLWAQSQPKQEHSKSAVKTAKVAGMQVAIDPKTGRLRQPTPEERQALARALARTLNRSTEGLPVTRYANGMERVDLQGRFQSVSVATVENGKVHERCVTNAAEAKAAAKPAAAAKPTPAPEVK
jgi:septal ring-binding cell division protein DamX